MMGFSSCVGLVLGENGAYCQPTAAAAAAYASYFLFGSGRCTRPFLWVQVLKPELAFFFETALWGHNYTTSKACWFVGFASFCDFGVVNIKAHLRLAVTAQLH